MSNSASWHVTSASNPRTSSRQFFEWLSLFRWPMLLLLATSSATLNKMTGGGGPSSYMGYPPLCAPGGVGRKPCRQGPPQPRPDGAGQFVGTIDEDAHDEDDDDDNEEDDKTSSDRWVSGSGPPGSFCLAFGVLWASGACGFGA
jgi:hypothetical protein